MDGYISEFAEKIKFILPLCAAALQLLQPDLHRCAAERRHLLPYLVEHVRDVDGVFRKAREQAQKMQQDMLKMQEELDARTYSASAGGGVVTAEVNGRRELITLTIDPEAVDPDDVEMLQDMVIAAVNSALKAAETSREESMAKVTGGLNFGF